MKLGGLLRVAALAVIWGSGFLLIKISLRGFTPVQLTYARLVLGALVLGLVLVVMRLKLPSERRLWLHLIVAALLANAIPYTLFGIAEQTVASNLAGAVNATTPLWTILFALIARRQDPLSGPQWAGMLLGFAGGLLILSPWQADSPPLAGLLACLAASASYGLSYVYMGRYLINQGLPPLVLSAGQLVAASGLLVLASPFGGFTALTSRSDAIIALLILGVIGTGVAYVINYRIISDDGPVLASTVTYLLPVVAVLLGAVVLAEPITVQLAAGVVIVLAGVALTRRKRSADEPADQSHQTRTAESGSN